MQKRVVWISVGLAFVLWYVMFVERPFNFWWMMSFSTALLSLITLWVGRPLLPRSEWTMANVLLGIGSAIVLYFIFWLGHHALILMEQWMPGLLQNRAANLGAIYANRGELPAQWVALLLFFPIGFGEEFYWRGLVQKYFSKRFSRWVGFLLTALLYTAVHVATGNVVLLLAAVVCGLYWGALYAWRGQLLPVLISHMLWDPFIFIVRPIM